MTSDRVASTRNAPNTTAPPRAAWHRSLLAALSCAGLFFAQAAAAQLLTFHGTIQFSESPTVTKPRGVAYGDLELWVCGNWFLGACSWSHLSGGRTDATGSYSIAIPGPRDERDQYQVRVYARNHAALVWQQDTASVFWTDVLPHPVTATPSAPVQTLSRTFGTSSNDLFVSRHLNAATKLLPAREFALKFRDPTETDTLGRVIVAPALATGIAFTNSGVIHAHPDDLFNENTLVHEYGHFVQESMGAYYLWPSHHDGCFIGDNHSAPENTPEFAWFEGFPEFFSQAVRLIFASSYAFSAGPMTPTLPIAYAPQPCAALGMSGPGGKPIGADAVESRVKDFLFLLLNDTGPAVHCPGSVGTAAYRACAMPAWNANAALIMGIFDKELDFSQRNPVNAGTFYTAWLQRGADRAQVETAMHAVGMATASPPPPPPPAHQQCIAACNLQIAACMLHAHGGPERGQCGAEGRACKAACP